MLLGIEKKQVQGCGEFLKLPRTTKTHQNHTLLRRTDRLTFSSVPLADVRHPRPGILPLLYDDFDFATLGSCMRSWHDLWFWWQWPNNISIYFWQENKTSL